ncbi:hypothetical protein SCG7086_AV_00090 [Chlamydiales bacterium SCGC AG-110-P3]|nr:hypothetical protein SCG7086_AV_00090 [Chlamydiales bacterium SCGC AG-110-P3]
MSDKSESTQATADVTIDAIHESGCVISATVTLCGDSARDAHKEAIKAVKKQVSIPGFRKGRAPDAMITSNYEPQIEKQLHDTGARKAFDALIKEEKVQPLNSEKIRVTVDKASKDEIVCKIHMECAPQTPLIDPADLQIEIEEVTPVNDNDVEERITEMREELADHEPVDARSIKEGDTVTLDIDTLGPTESDPIEPKEVCRDNVFKVEKGQIGDWLHNLLLDKNPGDEFESISERDETLPEDAEFTPTRYKITIKNLVEKQPLTIEQLAKKLGAGDDIDAFKQALKARMTADRELSAKDKTHTALTNQLLEKYDFELPRSPLEGGRRVAIKRLIRHLKEQDLSEEEIKAREGEIEQQAEAFFLPRLRMMFLADKYFSTNDPDQLNIEREQMMRLYTQQMMMTAAEQRIIDNEMSGEEMRNELIMEIMQQRLLDALIAKLS